MLEEIIGKVLLALHNIALVGCAAAPFYNRNLVLNRGQYGPKLSYELDKVVEDTLQGNAPYCIFFIVTLFVTGFGMPLNYYLFHGEVKIVHSIAMISGIVKILFVIGMLVIMINIFSKINPKLKELFDGFKPSEKPNEQKEKEFFSLRAKRRKLCEICLVFSIIVLVLSAFLTFKI